MATFAQRNAAAMLGMLPRPPGDVTTPPDPGTPRGRLLVHLGVPSLPSDTLLTDARVTELLAADAETAKRKFRTYYCTPSGAFYCEAERILWAANNPWCPPDAVPLVTVPVFTDEATRTAWIANHPTCPVPPPVLTDHTCTPGDPSCDTRTQGSLWPVALLAAGVLGLAWLGGMASERKNPHSLGSRSTRSALDEFIRQYLETALWSSVDDDGRPLDRTYDEDDFTKAAMKSMRKDAESFFRAHQSDILSDPGRAGHDFWLTRNRHGAGFWDGDWPDAAGKRLTKASHAYGSVDIVVGRDGKLHV